MSKVDKETEEGFKVYVPRTFERVTPDYLDPEIENPRHIYRYTPGNSKSNQGGRWYVQTFDDGYRIVISHSSIIKYVIPKSYGFLLWVARNGMDAFKIANDTATFGSVFHQEAFKPLITKKGYDLNWLNEPSELNPVWTNMQMLFPLEYREMSRKWYYPMAWSLLSFWKFIQDRMIKLIAVELPIVSNRWDYGGVLDLVMVINWRGKERLAIVDVKSKMFHLFSDTSEKKFYDEHQFQLELQRYLLIERYPDIVEKYGGEDEIMMFNWAPNNWRVSRKDIKMEDGRVERALAGGPTYTFTNQTDNKFSGQMLVSGSRRPVYRRASSVLLDAGLQIYDLPKPPTEMVDIRGSFTDVTQFNWEDLVEVLDL